MQRLKTRSQFQAALSGGTVARTTHFALHRAGLDQPTTAAPITRSALAPKLALFDVQGVWLAAMVPKRWAKRAVTRNTIRRQIYCVSADFELALPDAAHVIRLRSDFDRTLFPSATSEKLKSTVRQELQQLFATAVARPSASSTRQDRA
ncbi:ribonuclease P protein component [Rhodoferax sp. PAMC 29310]|uniref:ribonuclease P protein component n=1 Tax=Rhodoferax sp. PAMC 29310 TaxID=2822760 RepID=UPI001B333460|nr:ribonuclease P protein component [Rhodoferax sp. PAMC 29310]